MPRARTTRSSSRRGATAAPAEGVVPRHLRDVLDPENGNEWCKDKCDWATTVMKQLKLLSDDDVANLPEDAIHELCRILKQTYCKGETPMTRGHLNGKIKKIIELAKELDDFFNNIGTDKELAARRKKRNDLLKNKKELNKHSVDDLHIIHLLICGYFPPAENENSSNGRLKKPFCIARILAFQLDHRESYYLDRTARQLREMTNNITGCSNYTDPTSTTKRITSLKNLHEAEEARQNCMECSIEKASAIVLRAVIKGLDPNAQNQSSEAIEVLQKRASDLRELRTREEAALNQREKRDPTPTKPSAVESNDLTPPATRRGNIVRGEDPPEAIPETTPRGEGGIRVQEVVEDEPAHSPNGDASIGAVVLDNTIGDDEEFEEEGGGGPSPDKSKPSVTSSESTAVSTTVDSTVLPPSNNSNKLSATEEETRPSEDAEMNGSPSSIAAEATSTFSLGPSEDGKSNESDKSPSSSPVRAASPPLKLSDLKICLNDMSDNFADTLKKENDRRDETMQEKIDEIKAGLQHQIALLQDGNELSQKRFEQVQQRIEQVQLQLDRLRDEIDQKVSGLEGQIGDVRSDVSDVERTTKKTEKKVRRIEEDTRKMFDKLNEEIDKLREELQLQKEREEARKLENEAVGNNDFDQPAGGEEAVVVSSFSAESEEDESTTGAEGLGRRNLFPQFDRQEGNQDKEAKKAQKTAPKAVENVKKVRKQLEEQPDKKFEESERKHAKRKSGEEAVFVSSVSVEDESEEDESTTGAEGLRRRNLFPQLVLQEGKHGEVEGSEATSGAGSVSSLKTGGADEAEVSILIDQWNRILGRPGPLELKKLGETTNVVSFISCDDPIMTRVVEMVQSTIERILHAKEEERSTFGQEELENVLRNILGGENIKAAAERMNDMNDRYSFLRAVHSVFPHKWLPNYAQLSALSFLYLAVDGSVTMNEDFVNNTVLGTFLLAAGYRDQYTQRANGEVVLTLTKSFLKFMSSWEGRPESERERYGIMYNIGERFTDILQNICVAINELPIEAAPTAIEALEEILKFTRRPTSQHSINVDKVLTRVSNMLYEHERETWAQQLIAEYVESDESNSNVDLDAVDSDATQDDDAAASQTKFFDLCDVEVWLLEDFSEWKRLAQGRLVANPSRNFLGVQIARQNRFSANFRKWMVEDGLSHVTVGCQMEEGEAFVAIKPENGLVLNQLVKFFQQVYPPSV